MSGCGLATLPLRGPRLAVDKNNGELCNQRGDCPNGGENRSQDYPDRSHRHRNFEERVAVIVLYNDALDVALVDQFVDLADEVSAYT
jgi:hypothetical protein